MLRWATRTLARAAFTEPAMIVHDIVCGRHSGIPTCCIAWWTLVWHPFRSRLRGTWRQRYSEFAWSRANFEYIPCPMCALARRKAEIRSCRCSWTYARWAQIAHPAQQGASCRPIKLRCCGNVRSVVTPRGSLPSDLVGFRRQNLHARTQDPRGLHAVPSRPTCPA